MKCLGSQSAGVEIAIPDDGRSAGRSHLSRPPRLWSAQTLHSTRQKPSPRHRQIGTSGNVCLITFITASFLTHTVCSYVCSSTKWARKFNLSAVERLHKLRKQAESKPTPRRLNSFNDSESVSRDQRESCQINNSK